MSFSKDTHSFLSEEKEEKDKTTFIDYLILKLCDYSNRMPDRFKWVEEILGQTRFVGGIMNTKTYILKYEGVVFAITEFRDEGFGEYYLRSFYQLSVNGSSFESPYSFTKDNGSCLFTIAHQSYVLKHNDSIDKIANMFDCLG